MFCKFYQRNLSFLSVLLLCFNITNVYAIDVFKIAGNNHYVSGHWEELLTAALDITSENFGPYEIVIHAHGMGNERHQKEMIKGELINTRAGVTTPKREASYIPIKIPIRKGLLNYRLLVANTSELQKFSHIKTFEQLKELKVGLIDRWIISDIFEHHNFEVLRIADYDSFYRMLKAKRYDYTVRGVNEIYAELETKQPEGADFSVVPNIGVYINSPTYFFVSKRHPRLAQRIEIGLEKIIKNGQFDEIFYKWHQTSIDKSDINNRIFITVENSTLPDSTPTGRAELWFRP